MPITREVLVTAGPELFVVSREESVLRTRQAEIVSQRFAVVFTAKEPPSLQFRHDAIDEVVEAGRQIGEHHVETVTGFGEKPLLHLIGDRPGRTDEREAGIASDPLRQLAHRQIVASGELEDSFPSALARIALGNRGQRAIWIQTGDIVAECD